MSTAPRVVVVTRPTPFDHLVARHATRAQAAFFLRSRGREIEPLEQAHDKQQAAVRAVYNAIPSQWRTARVTRDDLARFLFEPNDTVVAIGQDGLVANVAKYLKSQVVVGVNPDREANDGVLVKHGPKKIRDVIHRAADRTALIEARTKVQLDLDDGQRIVALNEIFVGHRTHQSARYRLRFQGSSERHSSSGLIIATGTGATGWARSIATQRATHIELPKPSQAMLVFFVREAFPSVMTGTELTEGRLGLGESLEVISELDDDGVIFGDGIEADRLNFGWGMTAQIKVAETPLLLVASSSIK